MADTTTAKWIERAKAGGYRATDLGEAAPQQWVVEFNREMMRLAGTMALQDRSITERLAVVDREIDNLAANMLKGIASPTLLKLLTNGRPRKRGLEPNSTARAAWHLLC